MYQTTRFRKTSLCHEKSLLGPLGIPGEPATCCSAPSARIFKASSPLLLGTTQGDSSGKPPTQNTEVSGRFVLDSHRVIYLLCRCSFWRVNVRFVILVGCKFDSLKVATQTLSPWEDHVQVRSLKIMYCKWTFMIVWFCSCVKRGKSRLLQFDCWTHGPFENIPLPS